MQFFYLNPASHGNRGLVHPKGELVVDVGDERARVLADGGGIDPAGMPIPRVPLSVMRRYRIHVDIEGSLGSGPRPRVFYSAMTNAMLVWHLKEKMGQTGDEHWGVVRDGGSFIVDGVGSLWVFIMDENPGDNEGKLAIEAVDLGPTVAWPEDEP